MKRGQQFHCMWLLGEGATRTATCDALDRIGRSDQCDINDIVII